MIAFSRPARGPAALHRLPRQGVTVDIVPVCSSSSTARSIELVGGMPLLSIQQAVAHAAVALHQARWIVGASIVLLLLSPLLIVVGLAITLTSRGGVFFVQQRSGRSGQFFRLYKFRSMKVGSSVLMRDDGAIVKRPDDDRITGVGRFIRRFSLDEAPQLLNVLRGDMSLVGPRPLVLAEHAALSEDWQIRRADLRPGLTGPWQISGRSNIPFTDDRFDYQYVAGWSLARDIRDPPRDRAGGPLGRAPSATEPCAYCK
jgi:lipopolysaccharide/colanic/teichoic acid biosynthesis glycosyltransferase